MSYERTCEEKIAVGGVPMPMEPVSEQVRCIDELGCIANALAGRIFMNLFGRSNEDSCENARGPECMVDMLNKHRGDMKRLVGMLEDIASRLGV